MLYTLIYTICHSSYNAGGEILRSGTRDRGGEEIHSITYFLNSYHDAFVLCFKTSVGKIKTSAVHSVLF